MGIRLNRRTFMQNCGLLAAAAPAAEAGLLRNLGNPQVRAGAAGMASSPDALKAGFLVPPNEARSWLWWWWLNGYVTKEGIVKDLDEMNRQGVHGVVVYQAGGGPTPKHTPFMSPEWLDLFRFAVEEAAKRKMVVSLNLCSGWDAGGPWIDISEAPQQIVYTKAEVNGSSTFDGLLAQPEITYPYYRDICVMAWQSEPVAASRERKKVQKHVCRSSSAMDISHAMATDGRVHWKVPEGKWLIIRFGYTVVKSSYAAHTKNPGTGDQGYEVDPMRASVMDKHFAETAGKAMAVVKPYVGMDKTLQYFQLDSWELGVPNWTPSMRADFRRLRGYDIFPHLAALAEETIDRPEITARFIEDFQATLSDLAVANYYGRLTELSHQHGVGTHSESEGPELFCIDSLKSLGTGDVMMSEFWSRMTEPDGVQYYLSPSDKRFFDGIKGASSAAHIYGKKIVQAEAFTVLFSQDYSHYLFALKDVGDRAFCAGLNRNVFSFYVHQPELEGKPGYAWPDTGLKINRNQTWWDLSSAWMLYLTRCQYMFQQGRPVADICYFYGEGAPNYVPAKDSMIPAMPRGFDCDSINAEALLSRLTVEDGRLALPGGLHYRLLVMPARQWVYHKAGPGGHTSTYENEYPGPGNGLPVGVSAAVLSKIKTLVEGGATLLGDKVTRAPGLTGYPDSDRQVQQLADDLWGTDITASGTRSVGKGRVIWGKQIGDVLAADGIPPDFAYHTRQQSVDLPYIHYRIGNAEVYFVSNQQLRKVAVECRFRVSDRQPEIWDAVTGETRDLSQFESDGRQTSIPLEFAPRQSFFLIFRKPAAKDHSRTDRGRNFPRFKRLKTIRGPWTVSFDPKWGGPRNVTFKTLTDWTERPEDGIRYYSGTATYRKTFELPDGVRGQRLFLDLGVVNYLAAVRLNGKDLGTIWTAPWRTEISHALQNGTNRLEIDVVNLWPNRLIGDRTLPPEKRFTKTNVPINPDWDLLPSGLLGPVTLDIGSF